MDDQPYAVRLSCEHDWEYNKPANATASVRICATCHTIDGEDLMRTLNEHAQNRTQSQDHSYAPNAGADIEIIDRGGSASGILVPSAVRINGAEIAIPADATIKIHEIRATDVVTVTLTLFARRITIAAEGDLP